MISLKMADTSPEAQEEFLRRCQSLSPERRMRMVSSMLDSAKVIAEASMSADLTGQERKAALFMRFYSEDFSTEDCTLICDWIKRRK